MLGKRALSLFVLIIVTSLSVGCTGKESKSEIAEAFVRKALTVPNSEIAKASEGDALSIGVEELDRRILDAAEIFYGDSVPREVYADRGSSIFNYVTTLHVVAAGQGFTYEVEDVTMVEVNASRFQYIAIVNASNEEQQLKVTGIVQLDEDNKITSMSIKSRKMK